MSGNPPSADNDTGIERHRMVRRLSVAGVMVGLLLAVLGLFDYLATPPDESEVNVYTKPVPVPPRKEVSQPVIASSNLPEPPQKPLGTEVAVPPAPAVPEVKVVPDEKNATADLPEAPKVEAKPAPVREEPARAETRSSRTKPAKVAGTDQQSAELRPVLRSTVGMRLAPAGERLILAKPASGAVPAVGEAAGYAEAPLPREAAPAARVPSARVVQVQPAPLAPSSLGRLFSGFVLQAGVFNSAQRAEELHARLALSGVQSSVETRVQVGPFKSRQEAEVAQARLRELGIETVLVPPSSGKR